MATYDITSFGDTTRRVLPIGETITDPVKIAQIDAAMNARLAAWASAAEADAIAESSWA